MEKEEELELVKGERDSYLALLNREDPEGNEDSYPVLKRLKEVETALEASQREAAELLNAFRHTHGNKQDGTDLCKYCGLDLRNKIHLARIEKAAEKSEKKEAGE